MRACLGGVKKVRSDKRGKSVQRIDGCRDDAWTMDNKKKRERREKETERREEEEEEEKTAREEIWRSKGMFIYTDAYIPTRSE